MPVIEKIAAREILDSRGLPTVEAEVWGEGRVGRAAVPAGASTGAHEAKELRDGGKMLRGKRVQQAVQNVQQVIARELVGKDMSSQVELDQILLRLDGTEDKSRLGANAILAVSLGFARWQAELTQRPLFQSLEELFQPLGEKPLPPLLFDKIRPAQLPLSFFNVLNGGVHADNNLDVQEFMIVPFSFVSFKERLFAAAQVYQSLKGILREKKLSTAVGDEGGFAPNLRSEEEALDLLSESVERAGYRLGEEFYLALDVAASSFDFQGHKYFLPKRRREVSLSELLSLYRRWIEAYPILSIEDPLGEEDWEGWRELTRELGKRVQLVGDDIFVTNKKRLARGVQEHCGNAVLIKLNQIGTLTETLEVVAFARAHGVQAQVSHRSGETEDPFIAHFVVGTGCGQIKSGAPARGERTAKYNELLRMEEQI